MAMSPKKAKIVILMLVEIFLHGLLEELKNIIFQNIQIMKLTMNQATPNWETLIFQSIQSNNCLLWV